MFQITSYKSMKLFPLLGVIGMIGMLCVDHVYQSDSVYETTFVTMEVIQFFAWAWFIMSFANKAVATVGISAKFLGIGSYVALAFMGIGLATLNKVSASTIPMPDDISFVFVMCIILAFIGDVWVIALQDPGEEWPKKKVRLF